jgi:hypothetical protein
VLDCWYDKIYITECKVRVCKGTVMVIIMQDGRTRVRLMFLVGMFLKFYCEG